MAKPEKQPPKVKQDAFLACAGKVLDAFETLSASPSVGVTELARKLDMPPSTAYRALATLAKHGFAVKKESDKRYYPGPKILRFKKN